MSRLLIIVLFFGALKLNAQYAPQVPLPGHTAISKDDVRIIDWASDCTIYPGWINIADIGLGKTSAENANKVTGPPGIELLSLGDSGVAVLSFSHTIRNAEGPDFVVFENGFTEQGNDTMAFLELAFVEVSSDGEHFVRFPASSLMQDTLQIDNFTFSDARYYHNLAGKYISGYGTPFDLEELKDIPGLDIDNITHVRIIDVVGSIDPQYGSFDHEGRIINDPYPTPYLSSGFDLNAVGVINSNKPATGITHKTITDVDLLLYPNPVYNKLQLDMHNQLKYNYYLSDINGRIQSQGTLMQNLTLDMEGFSSGIYFLNIEHGNNRQTIKVIKR